MLKAKDKNGLVVYIDDADPAQQYYCQVCDQPVMQKRGEIRIHHFSHYSPHGTHADIVPCCDHWSYDMTEWHMGWQRRFSSDDIEKVLTAGKEKHIADLLINKIIVEFQHSPISLDDFNERNEFYTRLGYKVIWVFDLIEERENGRIRDDDFEGSYKWTFVKKLFREMNLAETKATIYFQFDDCEDDCGVLERVKTLWDEGRVVKTDSRYALSISEFVQMVKENSPDLFEKLKPAPAPQKIENCFTVEELWKDSYSRMILKNKSNDSVIFVYGKDGKLIKDYQTGRIRCSYAYLDKYSGYYQSKNQFYNVFDADKKIWVLVHAFKDKKYEERQKENNEILAVEKEAVGYQSLDEIVSRNTLYVLVVGNLYTHKRYYLQFIDEGGMYKTRFNIYEIDKENGIIKMENPLNNSMYKQYKYKIWKKIPLDKIYG